MKRAKMRSNFMKKRKIKAVKRKIKKKIPRKGMRKIAAGMFQDFCKIFTG
jgi:hypothetical protein